MSRRRENAFTLIELLVVIAIISLLVSILLPSLARVKLLGRRTVCASNLHQFSVCWALYWSDHDGHIPLFSNWYAWGGHDFGGWGWWMCDVPPADRPLSPHVDSPGLFQCPDDNRGEAVGNVGPNTWWRTGTSYVVNVFITCPYHWGGYRAANVDQVVEPARSIFLGDNTIYLAWGATRGNWPGHLGGFSWHGDDGWWSNVLFADGHCEFLRIDQDPTTNPVAGQYVWWTR